MGAVRPHDEVRDVDGLCAVARRRGYGRGQQVRAILAQRPGVAAHEHTSQVLACPQIIERDRIREVEYVERYSGARGHPLEQALPRRRQRGRPRVHAGGGDGEGPDGRAHLYSRAWRITACWSKRLISSMSALVNTSLPSTFPWMSPSSFSLDF